MGKNKNRFKNIILPISDTTESYSLQYTKYIFIFNLYFDKEQVDSAYSTLNTLDIVIFSFLFL